MNTRATKPQHEFRDESLARPAGFPLFNRAPGNRRAAFLFSTHPLRVLSHNNSDACRDESFRSTRTASGCSPGRGRAPLSTMASSRSQNLTPLQRRELKAGQRRAMLKRFQEAKAGGATNAAASRLAGASHCTIWRINRAVAARGDEGYMPAPSRSGRRSALVKLKVQPWVLAAVERLALQEGGTIPAAWRQFAGSKDCPPTLAVHLRRSVPPSLLKATQLRTVPVRLGSHVPDAEAFAEALKEGAGK